VKLVKISLKANQELGKILIKSPAKLTKSELKQIYQLITTGGEVSSLGLLERMKEAKLFAFYVLNNKIISVRALKVPLTSYRTRIFASAGVPTLASNYDYEGGWSYTLPEYRNKGLSAQLYRKLLENESNIYTTTRVSNKSIIRVLEKLGFKRIGKTYPGRDNQQIQLWVQ
jgi:GNAT superfamily N-acetyltransferase